MLTQKPHVTPMTWGFCLLTLDRHGCYDSPMTFYRIQPANRYLPDLLDEDTWQSRNWNDEWAKPQYGVSVCDSIDALVEYFQASGGYVDDSMVLVTLYGEMADELDVDHEYGAILIWPSEIVSAVQLPYEIINRIYEEE
jgi:hypothetical protein